MNRLISLGAIIAGLLALAGCKTPGANPEGQGDSMPGLLVGPEAIGRATPPVDLPIKESGKLCLRTAQEFEKKGQTEDAIRLYEKARACEPTTEKVASRRLAVLYDQAGEFSKSSTEYETLLKAQPKDANLLNDIGYSYYCRGDWANAEAYLTKAVQQDPNHKRAWVNLGLGWLSSRSGTRASRHFARRCAPLMPTATSRSSWEHKDESKRQSFSTGKPWRLIPACDLPRPRWPSWRIPNP